MNRIYWIDELKGFVLILVCLGHTNINISLMGGDLISICQAFRMSTFFFCQEYYLVHVDILTLVLI